VREREKEGVRKRKRMRDRANVFEREGKKENVRERVSENEI
jgi:hypothetical protein